MRETLRHLAATGKTVFVSSHVLGEVQQLADVIGIIANGRLVREGPIDHLLRGEGEVRVRVAADQVEAARSALAGLVPEGGVTPAAGNDGWLAVRIEPGRAAEVNQTLATAGIFASGLDAGNDLESLFLELTRGELGASREGTFFGLAGGNAADNPAGGPSGAPPAGGVT
ncbi:MAG: transporter related protein [Chloroflexi bacterium]|nr:transporter related protein [Chloroflexota bacterium]